MTDLTKAEQGWLERRRLETERAAAEQEPHDEQEPQ